MNSITHRSGGGRSASAARALVLLVFLAILTGGFVAIGSTAGVATAHAAPCEDCGEGEPGTGGGGGGGGPSGGPVAIEFRWWGAVVSLDRSAGCFAAHGVPAAGDLVLLSIPPPWGPLVLIAVKAHKAWIASQMGANGVDLHLNWAGFVHWVGPRGGRLDC
jgi:hypothetical protein